MMQLLILLQIALVSVSANSGEWDWCSGSNPCRCEDGWYPDGPSWLNTWWCYPCAPGTATMTSAGGVGVHYCSTCPRNTFAGRASGTCTSCPRGQYSDAGSMTLANCMSCPDNQVVGPSQSCEFCPKGTNSTSGDADCALCGAGYGWKAAPNQGCELCGAGMWSSNLPIAAKPGFCQTCADNFYLNGPGNADNCVACPSGAHSKAGYDDNGRPGCSF